MRKILFFVAAAALLPACSSTSTKESTALFQHQAQRRANQVDNVHYEMQFDLEKNKVTYDGYVEITFRANPPFQDIRLDFVSTKIHLMELNNKTVEVSGTSGGHIEVGGKRIPMEGGSQGFITLPGDYLQEDNLLKVKYTNAYDKNATGFHRFVDPKDKSVYLHTDFEPYDANRLFPGFDQPDLKATYKLVVTAPSDWKVITNSVRLKLTDGPRPDSKIHTFKRTKRFSTYLVALLAGPFHEWKSRAGRIPLGIYVRKSVKQHMDPKEFFHLTRQGFKFFERYFDIPYPFEKYDQIFLPEFNPLAMENVGAVTFSERAYVFRFTPTELNRQRRADTLMHEMAHMWFGNLVTMKWWDDLWLNESFATFMSTLALTKATRFKGAWEEFYSRLKSWAYWQDQLVTSHPIVATIGDTDETFTNFDGITYGKGASALKQLYFYLGPKKFRDGMRLYFKQNIWANTELPDFLSALEKASGKDLKAWSKEWLQSEGVNAVEAQFTCKRGKIRSFNLIQTPANKSGVLRTHKTRLALYYKKRKKLRVKKYTVTYSGERTKVRKVIGKKCPHYVFPNYQDFDYTKVYYDKKSLAFLNKNIRRFKSSFDRVLIWGTVWNMVRDQKMSPKDYVNFALKELPRERNKAIVSFHMSNLKEAIRYFVDDPALAKKTEDALYKQYKRNKRKKKKDLMLLYWDTFVALAQSEEGLQRLVTGLQTDKSLDQVRRWNVIVFLSAKAHPQAASLMEQEKTRDTSNLSKKKVFQAMASRPDINSKREFWNHFVNNPDKHSLEMISAGMVGFYHSNQRELMGEFEAKFFESVLNVHSSQKQNYATKFARYLYPRYSCNSNTESRSAAFTSQELPAVIKKTVLEKQDDLSRCIKIRSMN